ncbi:BQ5605_C002g01433 [Microbotryum silenes-dioicae]|uniref:BQ5605_C002g01433 protein n=1 Tax=Microbotryum silenes-dioicae TaxID=796604 RepID=A0A2X0LYS8_9BASI|nr:BQ5605_C002g01433 [Microbotryum silenes-dioicae]
MSRRSLLPERSHAAAAELFLQRRVWVGGSGAWRAPRPRGTTAWWTPTASFLFSIRHVSKYGGIHNILPGGQYLTFFVVPLKMPRDQEKIRDRKSRRNSGLRIGTAGVLEARFRASSQFDVANSTWGCCPHPSPQRPKLGLYRR